MKQFLTSSLVLMYLVAWLPVASVTYALDAPATCGSGTTPACIYFTTTGTGNTVPLDASGNITVSVNVNTGNRDSSGADVWVQFQTSQLDFVSGNYPDSSTFYPNNRVVYPITADATGLIKMTRFITNSTPPVYTKGTGVFATLTFKPKTGVTQTTLSFVYTPGATAFDSTVASSVPGEGDLLGAAPSAALTITSGSVTTGVLDSVVIAPTSATIALGGSQAFTATAKDSSGATITSGITYAWTDTGAGSVNPVSGTTSTYTAGTTAETATVTVTATQGSGTSLITKTATATVIVSGTFTPGDVPGAGPYITVISPNSGHKDATPQATILGGNFGTYDATKSKVYFGMQEAAVLDWSSSRIVVRVPAASDITSRLTVTVRVVTNDTKTAERLGYTYTLTTSGRLPDNGPETYTWIGLFMAAFGLAGLAYMKLAGKPATNQLPLN